MKHCSFLFRHKMHLQVSIVLLFILLTGGFCLVCYECQGPKGSPCEENMTCDDEHSMCATKTIIEYSSPEYGDKVTETTERSCATPDDCESWSITTGNWNKSVSIQCCDTDLCNEQVDIDFYFDYDVYHVSYDHDEKKCFACDEDEEDCSHIKSCMEDEDYCFTAKRNQSHTLKGCASKYICDDLLKWLRPGRSITCCEGYLCNGTQSVSQSLLFLCWSLLFFILLH
uniref:Si:dkey-102g19.3 n=1 Tax=Cyprinus carpio TaxID=7962 RepID=A0A8C2KJD9_CYPCA